MLVCLDKHCDWNFDRKHILVICHFVSVVTFFFAFSFGFAYECALFLEAALNVRYSVSCSQVFVFMHTWNVSLCSTVGFRPANFNHSKGLVGEHMLTVISVGYRSHPWGIEASLMQTPALGGQFESKTRSLFMNALQWLEITLRRRVM